jgi:SAM-dependent methyltransferase
MKSTWDLRANYGVYYQGKNYYTITALPFYLKRQKILLSLLEPYIENSKYVCDFGCGDGFYIDYFKTRLKGLNPFYGVDISDEMINKARSTNPNNFYYVSEQGLNVIGKEIKFDLIYSIAVFAHISDNLIDVIIQSIYDHLSYGGRLIIFEQVAPFRYEGDTVIRRTTVDYESKFSKFGFTVEKNTLFSFSTHRFFERRVAKLYFKLFCKAKTDFELRVEANGHFLYRFLSRTFLMFDFNPIAENAESNWGNLFMVFKK